MDLHQCLLRFFFNFQSLEGYVWRENFTVWPLRAMSIHGAQTHMCTKYPYHRNKIMSQASPRETTRHHKMMQKGHPSPGTRVTGVRSHHLVLQIEPKSSVRATSSPSYSTISLATVELPSVSTERAALANTTIVKGKDNGS